ncbi:S8 family peptidase [Paenibacillus ginsengarvi]|nr:S8 family peptidase [Paenibacillus ginsengarvi]
MAHRSAVNEKRSPNRLKMSAHLRRAASKAGRERGAKPGRTWFRVVIELKRKPTKARIRAMRRGACSCDEHFRILRRMPHVKALSARLSLAGLRKLCGHKDVVKVHLDRKLRISLNVATPSIGAARLQSRGITGKGVTIAIIDTGAYPHPDLTKPRNRIVAFKDIIGKRKKPYDDNGHGTHVAGDAAGNGYSSKGKFKGPASRARLVIVKAFDARGDADSSDVVAAVDWILRNRKKYNIRLVNMSFGTGGVSRCADDPVCRAAERAWKAGLVVVAAAGNAGPGARTIESPGISPLLITVGAVNDRGTVKQSGDTIASFSGRGPVAGNRVKPDLVAPGVRIISLRAPGSFLDRTDPSARVGKNYFRLTGTSMATPIVTGGAAQLLQCNPRLAPGRVKRLLLANAFRLQAGANAQGSGELNMRFLLAKKRLSTAK